MKIFNFYRKDKYKLVTIENIKYIKLILELKPKC